MIPSRIIVALAAALFSLHAGAAERAGSACEKLINLDLESTKIVSAAIAGPDFTSPVSSMSSAVVVKDPFCRVVGVISPSIQFEVWLPLAAHWNGKFEGAGNGGMAGGIVYAILKTGLENGYAVVSSDLGHEGGSLDGSFAINAPEKVRDWGHRATHEMTVKAKEIVARYYGHKARFSYFVGCSGGGRQGMMEAQRYPADYNGIAVGDPLIGFTHLAVGGRLWEELAMLRQDNGAGYIPAVKLPAIAKAVVAKCDALDGVKDGVLEDPRQCHFDPASMQCAGADNDGCLTGPQVKALEKIYAGARTSDGRQIYPGYEPGGELGPGGWERYVTGPGPMKGVQWIYASNVLKGIVHEDPHYDPLTFDYDRDVEAMDRKPVLGESLAEAVNAANPDLSAFRDHGGKLIVYHGWNDIGVSPMRTVGYYEEVAHRLSANGFEGVQKFFRLFMVPGMQHCEGGPGADAFGGRPFQPPSPADREHDVTVALKDWVEHNDAPTHLIATKYKDDNADAGVLRTHLLCPYPQSAHLKGQSSGDKAEDFECR